MYIDQEKNHAQTAYLLESSHIVEGAYKRGIYEFYNGTRQNVEPDENQVMLIESRKKVKWEEELPYLTNLLLRTGVLIEDTVTDGVITDTVLYTQTLAKNPYSRNSVWYKEWQRGFDTGYFRNLNTLKRKRYNGHSAKKENSKR